MIAPRRFLPSIPSLLALEAVARLGSATAAADELALTHSAISRQLKVLEAQIGVTLLRREGKGLALTPAGAAYARSVRDCLQDLARASLQVKAGGSRSSLNLAILPAFGMYWLTPRLRDFARAHPDILVNQSTRLSPVDFTREKFDAAIRYGVQDQPDLDYMPLLQDRVLPVCAPDFLTASPTSPQDLLHQPLLHLESRPGAWEQWFQHHDIKAERIRGMLFDQLPNLAEAAACGLGLALLPDFMVEVECARGRLIPVFPGSIPLDSKYYLTWPKTSQLGPALQHFMDYLRNSLPPDDA